MNDEILLHASRLVADVLLRVGVEDGEGLFVEFLDEFVHALAFALVELLLLVDQLLLVLQFDKGSVLSVHLSNWHLNWLLDVVNLSNRNVGLRR